LSSTCASVAPSPNVRSVRIADFGRQDWLP
jgi:hypothetical protein